MKEEKHIKKLRFLLHKVHIHIMSKDDSYISSIRNKASNVKLNIEVYRKSKFEYGIIYISIISLIDNYKIGEEVVKNIYISEKLKVQRFKESIKAPTKIVHRDNKDIINGTGYYGNRNPYRYPKKNRSKKTWKNFYTLFPYLAEKDNWDGNTSDKMK